MQTADIRPVPIADHRSTALTPLGTAVLAVLRAQELVRELDAADREYVARCAADLPVDLCTDAPPARAVASGPHGRTREGRVGTPALARRAAL